MIDHAIHPVGAQHVQHGCTPGPFIRSIVLGPESMQTAIGFIAGKPVNLCMCDARGQIRPGAAEVGRTENTPIADTINIIIQRIDLQPVDISMGIPDPAGIIPHGGDGPGCSPVCRGPGIYSTNHDICIVNP